MKYLKFEFTDRADMLAELSAYRDENGWKDCAVVELGYIVITPPEYDTDGNETKAAVLSDKYAVDVLFYGEYPELQQEVTPPPSGVHIFAGCEDLYLERYNEKK